MLNPTLSTVVMMDKATVGPSQGGVEKLPHHEQLEFCVTRARYRQGRKLTSVRVYTVNDESKYLIVNGVSAIKISKEFEMLCQRYGHVELVTLLPDYPHESYVEVYLVKYRFLKNARFAKKQMDGKSFYGQVLHVCYAPELETVEETREKLQDRRKSIAALTRHHQDPAVLSHVQKRKMMPPSAKRLMTQLRPEFRKESMDTLHHRVDNSCASTSTVSYQSEDGDDCEDKSFSTESCPLKRTVHETSITPSMNTGANLSVKSGKVAHDDSSVFHVECENTVHKKNGKFAEECVTQKKIKLYGNKSLLSYKQD